MALTLQQTDTDLQGANEAGVIEACATGTIAVDTIESLMTDGGTAGTTEQTVAIPASSSRLAVFLQSANGVPGVATWDAGDWIVRFNVTTAQMDTVLDAIWICRLDNAGSVVATIASETAIGADISGGGVFTRTLTASENTGTDTDEIYIVVELKNNFTMSSRTVGITPDQVIDTPLIVGQVVAIGQALETDASTVAVPERAVLIGLAFPLQDESSEDLLDEDGLALLDESTNAPIETDTAFPMTVSFQQFVAIGLAAEADTATTLTSLKRQAIGLALEADAAFAVTPAQAINVVIGLALESDTAFALAALRTHPIGLALETDVAQIVVPLRVQGIGLASETDLAQVMGALKEQLLGQGMEVDTAQSMVALRATAIGLALETDLAQPVTAAGEIIVVIGQAQETDVGFSMSVSRVYALGLVDETDLAQVIAALRTHAMGQASEIDEGLVFTIDKSAFLGLSSEMDTAFAMTVDGGAGSGGGEGVSTWFRRRRRL